MSFLGSTSPMDSVVQLLDYAWHNADAVFASASSEQLGQVRDLCVLLAARAAQEDGDGEGVEFSSSWTAYLEQTQWWWAPDGRNVPIASMDKEARINASTHLRKEAGRIATQVMLAEIISPARQRAPFVIDPRQLSANGVEMWMESTPLYQALVAEPAA